MARQEPRPPQNDTLLSMINLFLPNALSRKDPGHVLNER